jgi:hypothetical protein
VLLFAIILDSVLYCLQNPGIVAWVGKDVDSELSENAIGLDYAICEVESCPTRSIVRFITSDRSRFEGVGSPFLYGSCEDAEHQDRVEGSGRGLGQGEQEGEVMATDGLVEYLVCLLYTSGTAKLYSTA